MYMYMYICMAGVQNRPGDLSWGQAQEKMLASIKRAIRNREPPVTEALTYKALCRVRRRAEVGHAGRKGIALKKDHSEGYGICKQTHKHTNIPTMQIHTYKHA